MRKGQRGDVKVYNLGITKYSIGSSIHAELKLSFP